MGRPSYYPILVLAFACLLIPCIVWSQTFVVRQDGTGDAPTFQAGLDSMAAHEGGTLVVEPGIYEEDARLDIASGWLLNIVAPGGPTRTIVRSLELLSSLYQGYAEVDGLGIRDSTIVHRVRFAIRECRFAGHVLCTAQRIGDSRFSHCSFQQSFYFFSQGYIDTCQFEGQVTLRRDDSDIYVRGCAFTEADTAAIVQATEYSVQFIDCLFKKVGTGIAGVDAGRVPVGYGRQKIYVVGCRFEDLRGEAVGVIASGLAQIRISDSSMQRCGAGVKLRNVTQLMMVRDTLSDLSSHGIDIESGLLTNWYPPGPDGEREGLDSLTVTGCAGDGARIRSGGGGFSITNSTFVRNQGVGIRCDVGREGQASNGVKVAGNVTIGNGGAGVHLLERGTMAKNSIVDNTAVENGSAGVRAEMIAAGTEPRTKIERNLVAANRGAGLEVIGPLADTVQFNDAWMNRGGDYRAAVPLGANLVADPRFCDVFAGDFHVASSSPCAPSGPYGPIGALGVGCDVMSVWVDMQPQANNSINPQSKAPIEAAILGHPLFDPHRVDITTVSLGGVASSTRGRGAPVFRDVNHDDSMDLLLGFETRDLHLEGDRATLEGFTIDGAPFRGSDEVDVKGSAHPPDQRISRLSLSAWESRIGLSVQLDSPSLEPMRIEVFDIAGRRITSRDLKTSGDLSRCMEIQEPLERGVYLVRVKQGNRVAIRRVIILGLRDLP